MKENKTKKITNIIDFMVAWKATPSVFNRRLIQLDSEA